MPVTYPGTTAKTRKVGRKFASQAPGSPTSAVKSETDRGVALPPGQATKSPATRTPSPSESLFSIGELSINDADQLRLLMHESLTSFAVEIGTQVALSLLEDDVTRLCGEKSQRILDRVNNRHGTQPGYIILGGQKVAVRRPRVRSIGDEEVELSVYSNLQAEDAMSAAALAKMVRGVSCRDYEAVVDTARAGFGVKKSSVSRNFIDATREQVEQFTQRRFDETTFTAVFIDGIAFSGEMMVAALGVAEDGKLTVNRRQPHSRQSCKVTNRNLIQGRCGQVSEPNITKPSSFIRIGKSGACAAKAIRLIQGDPPHVSAGPFIAAMPPCRQAEPSSVNDVGVRRKSAEVVVLFHHTPLVTGRTEPARTGWSYRCTHAEDLLRPELTGVAFIDQPTLGAFLVDALLL